MTLVVVPVRYPLTEHSRATLSKAIRIANEEDASLSILHVNLYQENGRVTRTDLKEAVEDAFGYLSDARYVVRSGFLVEETILDEIIDEDADVVVIGQKQTSRWREMIRRLLDDPDLERFLDGELDCRIVTVSR
ncbi:universal stress protein [Halapricum desulfuricans]|uniref:Nucleotide-binding protein, UspA family n=1 Tax=Halapricum desulfuricans TaxID=2841257 RepID=A0A897N653_9EURY|nr:universal stress protein [Halapricum desulfuricans]QSG06549.1 Nucleotide-binding protein, UspA family [Halapricum desulfuricans]